MRRRRPKHAETGVSLVLVLIIVTVISVVIGALLTQGTASQLTTERLRGQAGNNYGADAATQAILNALAQGKIVCNSTTPTVATLGAGTTAPFYTEPAPQNLARNAVATCQVDAVNGTSPTNILSTSTTTATVTTTPTPTSGGGVQIGGGSNNLPNYALFATARQNDGSSPSASDYGIDFSTSANNKTICIEDGSVHSNTKVNASGETLGVRATGTGTPDDCSTGSSSMPGGSTLRVEADTSGDCVGANGTNFAPTHCSAAARIAVPSAPAPADPITRTDPAPTCQTASGKTYAAFLPGKYTKVSGNGTLNNPCPGKSVSLVWMSPGTYYFDFGSTSWTWPASLVGGTPEDSAGHAITSLNPSVAATLNALANVAPFPSPGQQPASCEDPALQSTYPGVEFVFGGASTFTAPAGVVGEICASYNGASPPIAIYGAASAVSVSGGGVTAETLCGASCPAGSSLINTDPSGQSQFYVKGFVYAPNAQVILTMKNSNGQLFNWGVVVRDFRLTVNGTSPTSPFIQLPQANNGIGAGGSTTTATVTSTVTSTTTATAYDIRYLTVTSCPATTSFTGSPTPTPVSSTDCTTVHVKVRGYQDLITHLFTTVQVLGWSEGR